MPRNSHSNRKGAATAAPTLPPGEATAAHVVTGAGFDFDPARKRLPVRVYVELSVSADEDRHVSVLVNFDGRDQHVAVDLPSRLAASQVRAWGSALLHAAEAAERLGFLSTPAED